MSLAEVGIPPGGRQARLYHGPMRQAGEFGRSVCWRDRAWLVIAALIAALLAPGQVIAQPLLGPAAASVPAEGVAASHGGHGWAVVPEPRGGGYLLLHFPPRASARSGALAGSAPGTVRMPLRLEEAPEAVAAVGDEVFLIFRPRLVAAIGGASEGPAGPGDRAGGMRSVRQVYSVRAVSMGLGDLWDYSPPDRLAAQASLPGDGDLVGFAGTPVGPAALIDRGPREGGGGVEAGPGEGVRVTPRPPPQLSLSVLHWGSWRAVALPEIPAIEGTERVLRRFMLASSEDGLALLATRPARQAMMWRAGITIAQVRGPEIELRRTAEAERQARQAAGVPEDAPPLADEVAAGPAAMPAVEVAWSASPLQFPSGAETSALLPMGPLAVLGSRVMFAHTAESGEGLALFLAGAGAPERLANIDAVVGAAASGDGGSAASVAGVVAWIGARRVGVVLAPAGESGDRGVSLLDAAPRLRLIEVSADTGAVLFDGEATSGSGLDRESFQAVMLVVLALTAVLLIWTVRAGGRELAVKMPEGSALAEPGRRLAAGAIDFIVAGVVAGWVLGVPLLDVLTLRVVLGPEAELRGAGVLVGVGVGMTALMEGVLGASAGKLAMGVRVVAVRGGRGGTWRAPGLARAVGRNLFRWIAWPIAIVGLGRADARHLGDRLSGTAVVVRVEEAELEEKDVE